IEHLARKFLDSACRLIERHPPPELAPECLACLLAHTWPGNVRELRNVIERAAVLSSGPVIRVGDLPASLVHGRDGDQPARMIAPIPAMKLQDAEPAGDLPTQIRSLERTRIVAALERAGGVQTEAARALGISRR